MKKIGILTSQSSMNVGGLLQAYCLFSTIKQLSGDCSIIPYVPEHHNVRKHPLKYVFGRKNGLRQSFFVIRHLKEFKTRKSLFEKFRKEYLLLSNSKISYDKLPSCINEYDCVFCGSDQLWNINQNDNKNGAYYLNFPFKCKAFSYAISFGDGLLKCPNKIKEMLPYLKKFSKISVRDDKSQLFLKINGFDSSLCLDPTLLPDVSFWNNLPEQKPCNEKYILVYGFENAYQKYSDLVFVAKRVSKLTGMVVINPLMNYKLANKEFINHFETGPIEFVNLVRNASMVITNSFHGTIFSLLFKRPFFVVSDPQKGLDNRKETLLSQLGLVNRVITRNNIPEVLFEKEINFDASLQKMYDLRKQSKDYLISCLSEEQYEE